MIKAELRTELMRKSFHMLSLCYLGVYKLIGYPEIMSWILPWSMIVFVIESARLMMPRMNAALTGFFGGIARVEEKSRFSGIIHTTFGALIVFWLFGPAPAIVSAALWCVAAGDAAAALLGKSLGKTKLFGSKKSVEGSLACFTTCAIICFVHGFGAKAALGAAFVATAVELAPTTRWFNDNLWMPVAAAFALALLS